VREFLELAFGQVELDFNDFVAIDPKYFRPTEVDLLRGDATKAREILGWEPRVGFAELVRMMVESELDAAAREKTLEDAGHPRRVRLAA
jgi:GDPmannose 4,6-dehydratase